jgi:hypothetical protein
MSDASKLELLAEQLKIAHAPSQPPPPPSTTVVEINETSQSAWSYGTISLVVVLIVVLFVVGFYAYYVSQDYKNMTVSGDLTLSNGNLRVRGDGDLTGSMQAEYVTLEDFSTRAETYVWADKNTLLWQSGTIGAQPPKENDIFGWTSKLAQTSVVPLINPTEATAEIMAEAYNNLVVEMYNRSVIFANPTSYIKLLKAFNVFSSGTVTIPNVSTDPNDTEFFNNGGNNGTPRKAMAYGSFNFSAFGVTNMNQIQSVQLNFYAQVQRSGYDYSDSRFGLLMDDMAQCHYDYAGNPVPTARFTLTSGEAPIGCNASSIATITTGSLVTTQDTGDFYIYDKKFLSRWFGASNNGTLTNTFTFAGNWFVGYGHAALRRCRFTRFVINYFANP